MTETPEQTALRLARESIGWAAAVVVLCVILTTIAFVTHPATPGEPGDTTVTTMVGR